MSAFDTNAGTPAPEDVITDNFLENLVGEGKKFTDPEALAKGKYEADKFVEDLKRQNAELREDMEKAAKLDELMELVKNQNVKPTEQAQTPVVDPSDTSSDQMTEETLKALIENHVSERDQQTTKAHNLAEADKVLTQKYGDSANAVLKARASELNMSVDEMKELASKNPKAFLRLVGTDEKTVSSGNLVGGSQRSESGTISNADVRNFAYYNKLRKENKKLYYSPKVQQQLMKDAESMKEAFYGN
jgi:hypothetical protein